MDTRTLTAGETFSSGTENLPEISFHIGTDSDFLVGVAAEMDEKDKDILIVAAELVRRWNAFPALVEALEGLLEATRKAKEWAEVQPQFDDDDGHFVGEWMDEARQALEAAKS